jgi:hypothetical protein
VRGCLSLSLSLSLSLALSLSLSSRFMCSYVNVTKASFPRNKADPANPASAEKQVARPDLISVRCGGCAISANGSHGHTGETWRSNNRANYHAGHKLCQLFLTCAAAAVVILTLIIMCGTLHRERSALKRAPRSSLDRKLRMLRRISKRINCGLNYIIEPGSQLG